MRRRIGIRLIMGMSLRMAKGTLMQFNHNDQNEQQFDALILTLKPYKTHVHPEKTKWNVVRHAYFGLTGELFASWGEDDRYDRLT